MRLSPLQQGTMPECGVFEGRHQVCGEVKYKLRALGSPVTYQKAMLIYVGLCGRSSCWFRAVGALVERHARAYVEGDALPQSVRTTV